jgi:hypothetical protein
MGSSELQGKLVCSGCLSAALPGERKGLRDIGLKFNRRN